MAPLWATPILCQMKYTSAGVSYLRFLGGDNDINSDVNKLDSALGQVHLHETGAPGHVDVIGLVSTIRPRRYGWNTSKEGSLWREMKKNRVKKIQVTNLESLGSLPSKNGFVKIMALARFYCYQK